MMDVFKLGFPEVRTPPHMGAKRALCLFGAPVIDRNALAPSQMHVIAIDIEGKQLQFYMPLEDWNRAMLKPVMMVEIPAMQGAVAPVGALVKPEDKPLVVKPDNG